MVDVLPDTSILIDLFNASPGAVAFAGSSPMSSWVLHPVVEAEMLVGSRDAEQLRRIVMTVRNMRRAKLTGADFDHCLAFVRRHTLTHGVGWPDCLIAATAVRLGLPIATLNDKHFRVFKGLKVLRPY